MVIEFEDDDIVSRRMKVRWEEESDYFSNQFTTKITVASTKETEEVVYEGTLYKWYPKIREEDIETDTSNRFVDTLRFNNVYLAGCGGDEFNNGKFQSSLRPLLQ